ncbi:MAG: FKBP-type peptidyl-prolyl cis-trans isomerase [Pseudomonadota bacterium]
MIKYGWLMAAVLATGLAQAGDPAVPPPAAAAGGNDGWRIGYTLGYSLGQRMSADIADLDTAAFNEGFSEAFARKPGKMSQEEMRQAFEQFQERRIAQLQAARQKLLADNQAKSDAFMKSNGKRKGVKTLKSGLQYEILTKGKGPTPAAGDFVTAHYRGTLPDGTEFDTTAGGEPVEFPLDRVIVGWQEGVRLMSKGAKYKLFVPPELGYGETGAGEGDVIGPNQALIFEVELIDFRAPPAAEEEGAAVEEAGEAGKTL